MTTILERFELKYCPEPNTGCWLWIGCCNPKGYGNFTYNSRTRSAHRVSYEFYVGPVPDGLTFYHKCRQRCCVNPDHLEPVTNKENILRGDGACAAKARAITCKNGHLLVDKYSSTGRFVQRWCRICWVQQRRENRHKKAGI